MRKKDTVLFDFDGTVMDTNDVILASWQHTFRTLKNREEDVEKLVKTFGEPLETTIKKFFPNTPPDEAIEIYRAFHREKFSDMIKLFPGIKELLAELKKKGYRTGLVTSRLLKTTMQGLEAFGIKELFDVIVTADDTARHKPDPQPVEIALEKLNSAPEQTVMLGDTMFDILCAKNAGVTSVLVSWSLALGGAEDFGESRPDFIISHAEELFNIID